ncbi:MAG: nucleotidyl transferase AbiEii/AbiGii toxin family protein [Treponema sp.]|nr:nucleotidyl transferase AbiEii/AbiGii toxin family protein [Treponema sp.]
MEYSNYYETKLYPVQNEVLKNLKDLKLPFYLTGGTALSRGYFNHRYSDDLDFFVNSDSNFLCNTEKAINTLKDAGFKINTENMTDSPVSPSVFRR